MRRIGIMIDSDSDLAQCSEGLEFLKKAEESGLAKVVAVITNSIHRNMKIVLQNLTIFTPMVDVWIIGAGAANHLTGTCDAYIRYQLKNDFVAVVGVAFEDKKNPLNTRAAWLSMAQVPGTQAILHLRGLVGEEAFFDACRFAARGLWPTKFALGQPKPTAVRTLDEALAEARKRRP